MNDSVEKSAEKLADANQARHLVQLPHQSSNLVLECAGRDRELICVRLARDGHWPVGVQTDSPEGIRLLAVDVRPEERRPDQTRIDGEVGLSIPVRDLEAEAGTTEQTVAAAKSPFLTLRTHLPSLRHRLGDRAEGGVDDQRPVVGDAQTALIGSCVFGAAVGGWSDNYRCSWRSKVSSF